jgi:hypothetical protein
MIITSRLPVSRIASSAWVEPVTLQTTMVAKKIPDSVSAPWARAPGTRYSSLRLVPAEGEPGVAVLPLSPDLCAPEMGGQALQRVDWAGTERERVAREVIERHQALPGTPRIMVWASSARRRADPMPDLVASRLEHDSRGPSRGESSDAMSDIAGRSHRVTGRRPGQHHQRFRPRPDRPQRWSAHLPRLWLDFEHALKPSLQA